MATIREMIEMQAKVVCAMMVAAGAEKGKVTPAKGTSGREYVFDVVSPDVMDALSGVEKYAKRTGDWAFSFAAELAKNYVKGNTAKSRKAR